MLTIVRHKPDSGKKLKALGNLTVSMLQAAKDGLPTRHVTMKSRGGLMFASADYYQLMCKIEDRFYCTVMMRSNFALTTEDVVVKIRQDLRQDPLSKNSKC